MLTPAVAKHNCYGHAGGLDWPSDQPAAMIIFACCGHTGQGLITVILRGLAAASVVLLVVRAVIQPGCLHLVLGQLWYTKGQGFLPMQHAGKLGYRQCRHTGVWGYLPCFSGQESLWNGTILPGLPARSDGAGAMPFKGGCCVGRVRRET